jgi:Cyclic nucleotide-binding domain/Ion channel
MESLRKMKEIITPWEALLVGTIALILLDLPLGAAFRHTPTEMEVVLDLAISAIFLYDYFTTKKGAEVTPHAKMKSTLSFIACLPLMSAAIGLGAHGEHWPLYLQVVKIFRLPSIIALMLERSKLNQVPNLFKFCAAATIALVMINAFSCVWLIIYPPGEDKLTDYVKAAYWLITTISTVGYGDITPQTSGGRIFAMSMMIMGATIWGIFIASASRMMLANDRRKERAKEKMEALHSFFNQYDVPKHLQTQAVGFFNHLSSRNISEDEQAAISELPAALQSELQIFMNLKPISRVSLFKGVSFECLSAVAKKLEQVYFSPGEKIIKKGDVGQEMYLIGHGTVTVHSGDHFITNLSSGTCVGEMALIGDGLRSTDVTSQSYCDVFKLSKEKFEELLIAHADLRINIENLVRDRKNRAAAATAAAATAAAAEVSKKAS